MLTQEVALPIHVVIHAEVTTIVATSITMRSSVATMGDIALMQFSNFLIDVSFEYLLFALGDFNFLYNIHETKIYIFS